MKLPCLPKAPTLVLILITLAGPMAQSALAQKHPTTALVAPVLTIDGPTVVATGVTPGGEVAWLAVERHPRGYYQDVVIHREVTLADITGQTQLDLPEAAAWKSIWLAVDLATGEAVGTVPEGYRDTEIPWSSEGLLSAEGAASELSHPLRVAELLLVRPGVGVWVGQAADGKSGDADGAADGQVVFALASLTPLGKTVDAPSEVAEADTVLAIDPARMQYSIGRIEGDAKSQTKSGQGGAP